MTQRPSRHLFLTGRPGVGKTTVVRRLVDALSPWHPAGFYTEELRTRGLREGFQLTALDGRRMTLAHVESRAPARVGRYGVDVAGFERLLDEMALTVSPAPLIVIDEIGKMECLSSRFLELVVGLLDSRKVVLATVAQKGPGFIQAVKSRPDVRLVTVTSGNRDELVDQLAADLRISLK